jgi:hypothetical protein
MGEDEAAFKAKIADVRGDTKGSSMTNLRRLLVILLLVAGWSFAGVQRADAQIPDARPELSTLKSSARRPVSRAPRGGGQGQGEFSTGRRIGAIFMNPLLGLGSYTMGDWVGGVIISAGYVVAGGFILWEAGDRMGMDWGLNYDTEYAGIPFIVGMSVAGATTVFGILRPIFYHSSGSGRRAGALGGASIAVIPAASPQVPGIKAVRLSYHFQF